MKRSFKCLKYLFLIVLTTFSCSVAFGQTTKIENSKDVPENWKTINTPDYFIEYPDSFELNTTGEMGTCFILFSKPDSPNDLFKENVNLIIQNLNNDINLDKFVEITENQLKTFMTNGKLIESKRIKFDHSEFQKFVFSGTQGIFHLKFEQYDWVKNNKAYILTLSCETNQFERYKKVGEEIMNSFKIK